MDSIDALINDFKNLANRLNYTSPSIEALCYLLAEAVYKEQLGAVNTVLESSPSRMKNLNTAIQYAMDEGFSVNRGKNQHIIIKNLRLSTSKSARNVKKYDLAAKVGKYNLYYANNYTFSEDTDNIVEFVVAKEIVSSAFNSENINTNIYTDALSKNLTEVYVYSVDVNNEEHPVNYTEIKRNIYPYINIDNYSNENELLQSPGNGGIYKDEIPEYWLCTSPDYSIRLWKYNKEFLQNNSNYSIKINEQFYYRSPRYLTDTINPEDIKSIPGFYFNNYNKTEMKTYYVYSSDGITFYEDAELQIQAELPQGYSIAEGNVIFDMNVRENVNRYYYEYETSVSVPGIFYENILPIERTTSIEDIMQYVNYTRLSNDVIRSVNDIANITLAFFGSQIRSCKGKVVTEEIQDDPPISDYKLYIYYTLPLNAPGDIPEADKNKFLEFLAKAYYIQHEISLNLCEKGVYEVKVDIGMTIYYNNPLDENAIINYLANTQKILGKQYEPERLVSELIMNFPDISWISLTPESVPKTDIADNQYYMFNKLSAIDTDANIKFKGE